MKSYHVIGVMSGTSMDGVDLAHCIFTESNGTFTYQITAAETVEYDEKWRLRLTKLRSQTAYNFVRTDRYYGEFLGQIINQFIKKNNLQVDFIASHGHTIFHQPENNLTTQIGDGNAISAITNLPVVTNFRAMDVVLGGQGAPLVGLGDLLLFSDYDMCLNIGGFANLSAQHDGKRIAYDVCPANILLNRIAREFDQEYDEDGLIAEKGKIDYDLLGDLNTIAYYKMPFPKTLGREWINQHFWSFVRESRINKEDKMRTLVDHIATQIANCIENHIGDKNANEVKVLATGGGVLNPVLVEHIRSQTDVQIDIPEPLLINYKEAMIFGLLGVLRIQNKPNVFASATGADRDTIGGSLYGDFSKLI